MGDLNWNEKSASKQATTVLMINRIRLNTSKKGGGGSGAYVWGLKIGCIFCLKVDGPINGGLIIHQLLVGLISGSLCYP